MRTLVPQEVNYTVVPLLCLGHGTTQKGSDSSQLEFQAIVKPERQSKKIPKLNAFKTQRKKQDGAMGVMKF